MTPDALANLRTPSTKGAFYQQCRVWHGYLSAVTFVALLFFSITGMFMNHPDWFKSGPGEPVETHFALTSSQIEAVRSAASPPAELVRAPGEHPPLRGA